MKGKRFFVGSSGVVLGVVALLVLVGASPPAIEGAVLGGKAPGGGRVPNVDLPRNEPPLVIEQFSTRSVRIRWNSPILYRVFTVIVEPVDGGGGLPQIRRFRFDEPTATGRATIRSLDPDTRYRILLQGRNGIEVRNRDGGISVKKRPRLRTVGSAVFTTSQGGVGS